MRRKSQKCIFIKYEGDEYGYRLWDYEHKKVIQSQNVIFNKDCIYKDRVQEKNIKAKETNHIKFDELKDRVIPTSERNRNKSSDETKCDEEPQTNSDGSSSSSGDDVP